MRRTIRQLVKFRAEDIAQLSYSRLGGDVCRHIDVVEPVPRDVVLRQIADNRIARAGLGGDLDIRIAEFRGTHRRRAEAGSNSRCFALIVEFNAVQLDRGHVAVRLVDSENQSASGIHDVAPPVLVTPNEA